MKFKALRKKSTGEFVHLDFFTRQSFTGDYPLIMSVDATMDDIKDMYSDIDFSDIELIEYEFKEVKK